MPAAIATTPPQLRPDVIQASETAFASALNDILLVTAIVALAAAVLSFVLIRSRDFVGGDERPAEELADARERRPRGRGRRPGMTVVSADRRGAADGRGCR